jgi:hypothetical protein
MENISSTFGELS